MTSASRLVNARRNIYAGLISRAASLILNFAVRTAVIYIMGTKYQGLSDLFTSILLVLNMSDLGFSAAATYILYKPIAHRDTNAVCAIISFLRKVYRIIGIAILVLGLSVMPFLHYMISGEYPADLNLYVLFFLYLLNASSSYFLFAYKSTLLTALQRNDIVNNAYTISSILTKLMQITLLFILKDYYVFVLILPIGNVVNNIFLELASRKKYPQFVPNGSINDETKKELIKQVKAIFINRISDIARNSFDNIILSFFLGLVTVTIYSNYFYIHSALYGVMGILVHSVMASVGNSLVMESKEKNYRDMHKFTFVFMWVVGWCSICMGCLYQPFMNVWMNNNYDMLLSNTDMILFCIYFYAISMNYTKGLYLEAKGLFHECRMLYVMEAVGNLILNVFLCILFGVTGIIIASIVTIFLFNFIGGTSVLFKCYFRTGKWDFYRAHIRYFVITVMNFTITYIICGLVSINILMEFCFKFLICLIIPNLIYVLSYHKEKYFSDSVILIKRIICR